MKRWILYLMVMFLMGCQQEVMETQTTVGDTGEFSYTYDNSEMEACYISIIYLDGYHYTPVEWLKNDWYGKNNTYARGDKIGRVTLDLKGKIYSDIPPSFSSTLNVGTEIYAIEGVKVEHAILVVDQDYESVFYRDGKALKDGEAMNLKLTEVLGMVSDDPQIMSLELRDENNGSWQASLEDDLLNGLLDDILKNETLLTMDEMEGNPYTGQRIPINIVFKDGSRLHMQVYPSSLTAFAFGGYLRVTEAFVSRLEEVIEHTEIPMNLGSLLFGNDDDIEAMMVSDVMKDTIMELEDPRWSGQGLAHILSYYRIQTIEATDSPMIFYAEIKRTDQDMVRFELFEDGSISVDGERYGIIKGSLDYKDVLMYIDYYTEW